MYLKRISTSSFRLALAALIAVSAVLPLSAKTIKQPELRPLSPLTMAQGGSSVATARGYESLFTNPAGIARTEGMELTLPSFSLWTYSQPGLLLQTIGALGADESLSENDDDDDPMVSALKEQFTTNGFGVGSALGFGYVNNGIGLGLSFVTDSYLHGEAFPLGLEGTIQQQMSLAVGYARPFELGPVALALGGTLRPTLRIVSLVDSDTSAELVSQFFGVDVDNDGNGDNGENGGENGGLYDTITALNGWGVAFDLGMMATYESFTLGVQARNLFNTRMEYSRNSLNDIAGALSSGGLPEKSSDSSDPSYVKENYVIPVEYSFGVAWHPDLGETNTIFRPTLHGQITDPFKLTDQDRDRARSFWTRVHVGTQLRLLDFFDLRFGLNQGYFTSGFGVQLAFMEVNFAMFSQEYGRYPGDQRVSGSAVEFAFRF